MKALKYITHRVCLVPWMGHGYPWIQGVSLDGQVEPGYPQQGIFCVDAGYRGPQKSGG